MDQLDACAELELPGDRRGWLPVLADLLGGIPLLGRRVSAAEEELPAGYGSPFIVPMSEHAPHRCTTHGIRPSERPSRSRIASIVAARRLPSADGRWHTRDPPRVDAGPCGVRGYKAEFACNFAPCARTIASFARRPGLRWADVLRPIGR